MNQSLSEQMLIAFSDSIKIGLVATIDDQMEPHITVLSTLQGKDKSTMMLGKFVEGLSKEFMEKRPKVGFFIMNPQKQFWYGTMEYTSNLKEGEDYIYYNNQPLYRYNAYFGINTVYYFNLIEISNQNVLPMGTIIKNALKVLLMKRKYINKASVQVMKPWAIKFIAKLDTLKFLSYIDDFGFSQIIPIIQAQSAGTSRILFTSSPYTDLLSVLKKGQKIAILAFSMSMEDILLKGTFSGFHKNKFGVLEIERVYNSMPPVHGYIYPFAFKDEVKFNDSENVFNEV